jgi:hypothetical protein
VLKTSIRQKKAHSLPSLRGDFENCWNYNKIRVPQEVTEELAENVGIHISDGYMSGSRHWEMIYGGHAIDDFPYYTFRFVPLLKRLWKTSRIGYKGINGEQTLKIRISSKQLALFKNKVLGLPYGKKGSIVIPKYFLRDERITRIVIRGLFDGDGCLSFKSKDGLAHTYPVLSYISISKPLIEQLKTLLEEMGFTVPTKLVKNKNGTLVLFLNGDANYERWMDTIGFNNPKHLTKVVLYESEGIVPPETGLIERVKLIRGDIGLSAIYPVKELRINENNVIEKKVLERLIAGKRYIKELGRACGICRKRVANALRRLSKKKLVEHVQTERDGKKYYRITLWGINKLNRVETIVKRLREEFHLAV